MNIEIDHSREDLSGIEVFNWDHDFTQKIHEWYNRNHKNRKPGDGFQMLAQGHCALLKAVEEILGETQEDLTITLRIKGRPVQ